MDTRSRREIYRQINITTIKQLKEFFERLGLARIHEDMKDKKFLLFSICCDREGIMEFSPSLTDCIRVKNALIDTLNLFSKRGQPFDLVLFTVDASNNG